MKLLTEMYGPGRNCRLQTLVLSNEEAEALRRCLESHVNGYEAFPFPGECEIIRIHRTQQKS